MSTYHVYTHKLDGVVIYVGKGVGNRPYSRVDRSRVWKDVVGGRPVDVEILESTDDPHYAVDLEASHIKRLRPRCNTRVRGQYPPQDITKKLKHDKQRTLWVDDELLEKWQALAEREQVSKSAVVRRLINQSYARSQK